MCFERDASPPLDVLIVQASDRWVASIVTLC